MVILPDWLHGLLARPAAWLKAYQDWIDDLSRTEWFPKAMRLAFIGGALFWGLTLALALFIGWAASFFVFAIPLLVCLPMLYALHRRQRLSVLYSKELRQLERRAQEGDAAACFDLGRRYLKGAWDAPKDAILSALWFRQGAEQGHVEAMVEWAEALAWGHGVARDKAGAAEWFGKAAALGHARAQARLRELETGETS